MMHLVQAYWWMKRLIKDEKGQGMVEYALIIALVAIAVIIGITAMTGQLQAVFSKITTTLQGATQ